MAQQKIIIGACVLVAGLIAIAAAQSGDSSSCMNKLEQNLQSYRQSAQERIRAFADNLRKHGNDAADADKFNKKANELIERYIAVIDVRQGFSLSRITKAYSELLDSQIGLYEMVVRIDTARGVTDEYFALTNDLSKYNTNLITKTVRDCLGF